MSFKNSFCPSPWFHMRINNSGTYEFCRWMDKTGPTRINQEHNIRTELPLTYFRQSMAPIRQEFLEGQVPGRCNECVGTEQHDKVSGRQRQLLKVGVMGDCFEKSLASSPLKSDFDYSNQHQGLTQRTVSDWQIDLGNYCNSGCVFCGPESSSRLASEFLKLGMIDAVPPPSWCDDPVLLQRFVDDLIISPNLQYLHFIGGETLITPGFKSILIALVDSGIAQRVTIGFTTNLTVWSDDIANLLVKFQQVNLGLSVETLTKVNDYVRWPSELGRTYQLLERWRKLGEDHNWLLQIRITPTALSIGELTSVYEYAWNANISVESCNFLINPSFMRIGVLPLAHRKEASQRLLDWIQQHPIDTQEQIINTRDPNLAQAQIHQDAESYVNQLLNAPDESYRLPDLVLYLKRLESSRGNSILTYLPEYEDLLRSAGY